MPKGNMERDDIPNGTKVIKINGEVTYIDNLGHQEVPSHVIISTKLRGWRCILDTSLVRTGTDHVTEIRDVDVGSKIKEIVKEVPATDDCKMF